MQGHHPVASHPVPSFRRKPESMQPRPASREATKATAEWIPAFAGMTACPSDQSREDSGRRLFTNAEAPHA